MSMWTVKVPGYVHQCTDDESWVCKMAEQNPDMIYFFADLVMS